jgi:hypothetical protein
VLDKTQYIMPPLGLVRETETPGNKIAREQKLYK